MRTIFKSPYLFIISCGLAAFAMVLSMRFSLKNDILVFDYPIKFFINNSIQQGQPPLWLNTWAKGFPFNTMLTWSAFSPLQLVTILLGPYSLYILHLEFLFYVCLAGCTFFWLLHRILRLAKQPAILLALPYMLSGFVVGSSQWLGYISCASLLPLVVGHFLLLLRNPCLRTCLLSAGFAYLFLTSVYVPLSIVSGYMLASAFVVRIWQIRRNSALLKNTFLWSTAALLLSFLLLLPAIQNTLELLPYLDRGHSIANNVALFHTNYLHPSGLLSLIAPLHSGRLAPPGTEGSMMHLYLGLGFLILLSTRFNRRSYLLSGLAAFWLLASMGHLTPVREWLNILPGFALFRNAGMLRFFFIFFGLLALAQNLKTLEQLQNLLRSTRIKYYIFLLFIISSAALLIFIARADFPETASGFSKTFAALSSNELAAISLAIQIPLLLMFLACRRSVNAILLLTAGDLILNTLLCNPFFTVSSYSVNEVMNHLNTVEGFPVQLRTLNAVQTEFREGDAVWYNLNVFSKEISTQKTHVGPLDLRTAANEDLANANLPIHGSALQAVVDQQPGYFECYVQKGMITLEQNYAPGWEATLNGKPVSINRYADRMLIETPSEGELKIRYGSHSSVVKIILVNAAFFLIMLTGMLIKPRRRPSSL